MCRVDTLLDCIISWGFFLLGYIIRWKFERLKVWISVDEFCFLSKASIPNLNLHKNTTVLKSCRKWLVVAPGRTCPNHETDWRWAGSTNSAWTHSNIIYRLICAGPPSWPSKPDEYVCPQDVLKSWKLLTRQRLIIIPKKRNPNKISAKRLATITSYHLRRWVLARTVLFGE